MAEIPSNVFLAEQFAGRFDGFSIGSNDLTQLVLGVDRDSAVLSSLFDEQNEAVKTARRADCQGTVWATGYNVVAIPLAAGVLYAWGVVITPAVGAALMAASTVIVAINARMLTLKKSTTVKK